jgi:hypothetical protein
MKRIDTATRAVNLFGAGKDGYKDGDLVNGIAPTDLNAAAMNGPQEEILAVVEAAGIAPSGADLAQLLKALYKISGAVVGNARNLRATLAAAGVTVNFTADELVVKDGLGGAVITLANFNQSLTVNAPTGAGGMDTGAPPVSAWVAIYAGYNPATGARCIFGQATPTATTRGELYGGVNAPAGFTHTALLMVWPTTAGANLIAGAVRDRRFSCSQVLVAGISSVGGPTLGTSAGICPANAKRMRGYGSYSSSVTTAVIGLALGGTNTLFDVISGQAIGQASLSFDIQIVTPQAFYYQGSSSSNFGAQVYVSGYEI